MADAGRSRRPSGSGPETANRELFLRLLGQGLSNSAACRQVGVHRRTGTRWRYGRRAVDAAGREYEYPSIMQPAPTISDRFLSPRRAAEHRRPAPHRHLAAGDRPGARAERVHGQSGGPPQP